MRSSLFSAWRGKRVASALSGMQKSISLTVGESAQRLQLQRFNSEWPRISLTVPYYRELKSKEKLPDHFGSWAEIAERFPVVNRSVVQQHRVAMSSTEAPADYFRVTGGSTSEPISLPAWKCEHRLLSTDVWYARSWWGVAPSDRLFLLWGHAHLMGAGVAGVYARTMRSVRDQLLGYTRVSAYDLGVDALKEAGQRLLESDSKYMLGYAVALDRFTRCNRELWVHFRRLGLKVVIGTAENFPFSDSADLISEAFGCPVAMEYGSVETNLVAHSHPAGGYQVLWHNYCVEVNQSKASSGADPFVVTSLYRRCFPLIRYDLGDGLILGDVNQEVLSCTAFESVVGRCNNGWTLADGSFIHSEVFTHAVRSLPNVIGYQVKMLRGGETELWLSVTSPLESVTKAELRRRLGAVDVRLSGIIIRDDRPLLRTAAGKSPMLVDERESGHPL